MTVAGGDADRPGSVSPVVLPPARTPEQDPNVTRIGPKIGLARRVLPADVSCETFSPNGRMVVYFQNHKVWVVSLDEPDAPAQELMIFAFQPRDIRVLNDELELIVQEGEPSEGDVSTSNDLMRIWWVERPREGRSKEKQLLHGPEKDLSLADAPVSPDLRFVALEQWSSPIDTKGRSKKLHILDREEFVTVTLDMPDAELSLTGWKMTDAGLRAQVVLRSQEKGKEMTCESYVVDPLAPDLEKPDPQEPRVEIASFISPDGKHRVHVHPEELIFTQIDDGEKRPFVVHADDLPFIGDRCVEWLSPRYLKLNGTRLALIDITTIKMSYPVSENGWVIKSSACKFSSDFRRVLFRPLATSDADKGLYVAPVESPTE